MQIYLQFSEREYLRDEVSKYALGIPEGVTLATEGTQE